jgi:hypothetical protein
VFLGALILCVVLVPLVSGVRLASRRFLPILRRRGGSFVYWLALAPWLTWLSWLLFVRGH